MARLLAVCLFTLLAIEPARPAARPAALATSGPVGSLVGESPEKWGLRVVSLRDDRLVYAHNSDLPMQPASCQKILTTAAALDGLGPSWTARTSVYAAGEPRGGVLDGDLLLYGRGDPNLSARFVPGDDPLEPLRRLAAELKAKGLVRVEGGIVADESYLSGTPHGAGWGWEDLQWYFGTEVSALSFNDNLASIQVVPGPSPGAPCVVRVTPDIGYVEIVNETATGGVAKVSVHRSMDTSRVVVGGSLPPGHAGWTGAVAVHKPARYTAAAFRRALADAGIEVKGGTRVVDAYSTRPEELELDELVELAAVESRPLAELITVVNKRSQNLHAELILRILGTERGPADLPSDEAGAAVMRAFLERVGAPLDGAVLRDGSGLSRLDRVTPRMFEAVLAAMARHEHGRVFAATLPVSGVDGTLRGRLRGVSVSAKTGSLQTAKSLAGYLTTRNGERLAFSILYNDTGETRPAIGRIDRIVTALAAAAP